MPDFFVRVEQVDCECILAVCYRQPNDVFLYSIRLRIAGIVMYPILCLYLSNLLSEPHRRPQDAFLAIECIRMHPGGCNRL